MKLFCISTLFTLALNSWCSGSFREEICASNMESFSASCPTSEVLMMNWASFGRMHTGRCATSDLGTGCGSDVLHLADRWCSGRRECRVQVPNKELVDINKCPVDFAPFLEVDYQCIPVLNGLSQNCRRPLVITAKSGILSNLEAGNSGCGSAVSPLRIEGTPGQRINISMIDFSGSAEDMSLRTHASCVHYGYLLERRLGINKTLCGGGPRHKTVYVSTSSSVEVVMSVRGKQPNETPAFLIQFQVIGCADAVPPPNAWYKRNGDSAEIGCQWSDTTWQLKCEDNHWMGQVGNCSAQGQSSPVSEEETFGISPVLSLWMIVGLTVAVIFLLVIAVAGFTRIKRHQRKLTDQKAKAPEDIQAEAAAQPTLPMYAQVRKDPSRANTMQQPQPKSTTVNRQQPSIADSTLPPPPTGVDLLRLCNSTLPPNREGELYENTVEGRPWVDTSTAQASTENSRGQQFNSEGDYLIPCHTGTPAAVRAANSIYDTVGVRLDSEVASNDDYWVAESSNFKFYSPNGNS